jgi:hypothetical protein
MSVMANTNCPDKESAERAVNEVWESCFNDTRPFDEVRLACSTGILTLAYLNECADILIGCPNIFDACSLTSWYVTEDGRSTVPCLCTRRLNT